MVFGLEQRVQREHVYAIIDEVDSILIDEARTPLIISGPGRRRRQRALSRLQPPRSATWCASRTRSSAGWWPRASGCSRTTRRSADAGDQALPGAARHAEEQEAASSCSTRPASSSWCSAPSWTTSPTASCRCSSSRCATSRSRSSSCSTRRATRCTSPIAARRRCRPHDPRLFIVPDISQEIHADRARRRPRRRRRRPSSASRSRPTTPPRASSCTSSTSCCRRTRCTRREVDYIVQEGQVLIVDEFTGRIMHGPALVGRPAPGGRGQGRRDGQGRDPDARHDHHPELLPDVREARRHDRHGRDRGDRVLLDLQARGRRHPDQQADAPRSTSPTRSTRRAARSTTRSPTRSSGSTARAGRC